MYRNYLTPLAQIPEASEAVRLVAQVVTVLVLTASMVFLGNIILLALLGFILHYWWQSGEYKGRALRLASQHCQQLGLQLLDQSMVIKGYWPMRLQSGSLVIRRRYNFEFTSTGQQRYCGKLVLLGFKLESIELETYQLPE